MNNSGIYCIRNIENGKVYIGSAVDINDRFSQHRHRLGRGTHHSIKLQNSWNKHGKGAFAFEILEVVMEKSHLIEREQFWINFFLAASAAGYNIAHTAGSPLGVKRSAETRAKLALFNSGLKQTPETIEKRVVQLRGKKRSDECKQKLSAVHKGKPLTEEHRLKLSIAHKGLKYPNRNMNGYKHPPETLAKMSAGHKGFKHSQEAILKMMGNQNYSGNGRPLTLTQLQEAL